MHVQDIPKEQLAILASIFYHPPSEPWIEYASRVYGTEPRLDRNLLRPDFLHRLVQLPQSVHGPLCKHHKFLNAQTIHEVFILVATEVGLRLNRLIVAGRDKVGHETWDNSILNLRSMHGAWMQPEMFWDTFGKTLDVPSNGHAKDDYMIKWQHEENSCEACVLKRVGGDLDTVFDLQMVLKSRTRTKSVGKHREPRLSKIVDCWLKLWEPQYQPDAWREKLKWNQLRADRLKEARKALVRAKRQARRERGASSRSHHRHHRHHRHKVSAPITSHEQQRPGSRRSEETINVYLSPDPNERADSDVDEEELDLRATIHDVENDIIDCYSALVSTPFLAGMNEEQHEKRASTLTKRYSNLPSPTKDSPWPMVQDSSSNPGLDRTQSARQKPPSTYSESIYSQPSTVRPPANGSRHIDTTPSKVGRSNSFQERRLSDQSWATASLAGSAVGSQVSTTKGKYEARKNDRSRFGPIMEESSSMRSSRHSSRYSERPVSPLNEEEYRRKDKGKGRAGDDSPISPIFPKPGESHRSHSHRVQKETRPRSHYDDKQNSSRVHASDLGSRNYNQSPATKAGSRLSRPFDAPAIDDSLLSSVRQLRDRESVASDITRWSSLYQNDRDRIKREEASYQVSKPKHHQSDQKDRNDHKRG